MTISIKQYNANTSGLGVSNSVRQHDLILRFSSPKPAISPEVVLKFSISNNVGDYLEFGSGYCVSTYKPFGFGGFNQNYNRAPFWNGDKVGDYYGYITFYHDEITNITYGELFVNDNDISKDSINVLVTYTDSNNNTISRYFVTDKNGKFSDDHKLEGIYAVVGKAQLMTPISSTINIISRPIPLLLKFENKKALMTEDHQFVLITENNNYLTK